MQTQLTATQPLLETYQLGVEQAQEVFNRMDVAEATRKDYQYRIGLFCEFVQDNGFTRDTFLDFKRYLRERTDWRVATKNKYLAVAKIFLKELNRLGLLPADITQNTGGFRQGTRHRKEGLSSEEISLLTGWVGKLEPTLENNRLRAILALLTLQGLRQVEVSRLDIEDIDLVRRTALVHGKGRDDKEAIDLHPQTVRAIKAHLETSGIGSGALFVSRSNGSRNHRLSTRAIRGMVKEVLTELGIDRTTHGFRHYFTTRLIEDYQGDLLEVARYTRHKSLGTLQVYNDAITRKADLPRFYRAFEGVSYS